MLLVSMLLGCGPSTPSGYATVISVSGDQVSVGGRPAGHWDDRAFFVEREGDGTLKGEVARAIAGTNKRVVVDVPEGATFGDMWQLIAPAVLAGAADVSVRSRDDAYTIVPLSVPAVADASTAAPTGVDTFGVLSVHFDGSTAWIEGEATFGVRREAAGPAILRAGDPGTGLPVDCAVVFADAPTLVTACQGGRSGAPSAVALGGPIGCMVSPTTVSSMGTSWPTELAAALRTLDPKHQDLWTIVGEPSAPADLLPAIALGVLDAGQPAPAFAEPAVMKGAGLPDCTDAARDSRSLDQAGAAWLGSLQP